MTLQVFDFEGTDGATLSGTGITLGGTGTAIFAASEAIVGSTGAKFTANAANVRTARVVINSAKVYALDIFLRTPTTPASGTYQMFTLRHASGTILAVEYGTTNTIGIFETAGATRNVIPSVTIANNTFFRIQLLVSIGVATNDSTLTAKVFSSGSNWTTQVGTTLTRSAINLGTVNAVSVDIGAVTTATPGIVVGADYFRADDGKTTDFAGPPSASAPTCVITASDLYPEEDSVVPVSFSYSGSTAGTGSITGYNLVCTAFPVGASSPAITGPTTSTPSFIPTAGSRYEFDATVTQTGGLTNTAHIIVYPHPISSADVKVYSVTAGTWTNEGGAASLLVAINDASATTYAQTIANPTGQVLRCVMDPYGPGSITVFVSGNWIGGALNRTVNIYMPDGVTLLHTDTYALTSVEVERAISLTTGELSTASPGLNRRALVVDILDNP